MIKTLPQIYPDELAFSYLSRCFACSGYAFRKEYIKEVFKNPKTIVDKLFLNELNDEFKESLERIISLKELMMDHTLLGLYFRFLPREKRFSILMNIANGKTQLYKKLPISPSTMPAYLRYCPACLTEDKEKYGESYYHLHHQFCCVSSCGHHGLKLLNTSIFATKNNEQGFVPLDFLDLNSCQIQACDLDRGIAKYTLDLMAEKQPMEETVLIGDFLTSRLDSRYFCDKTRLRKDISKLCADLDSYCLESGYNKVNKTSVMRVLLSKEINVNYVILLANFEKIQPENLASYFKENLDVRKPLKTTAFEWIKKGFSEAEFADKFGIRLDRATRIFRYCSRTLETFPHKKKEDEKALRVRDETYSEEIRTVIDSNPNLSLTIKKAAEHFGIVDKKLRHYPKLREVIRNYQRMKQKSIR